MTSEEILTLFRNTNALLEGHFQLTSGLHSPQYFQCAKVLQHPEYAEKLCRELSSRFQDDAIDVVISPALGGIVVGQEVGRQLGIRTIFTERKEGAMELRRGFEIARGEKVLVCEDVITTGGSVNEVIGIVERNGGTLVGVGAIVDRSAGRATYPRFTVALTMHVVTYPPADCPLCKKGIPVDKPGSRVPAARK
ncbi:MAG TPA: orotate phosphoribosyltransferase [Bacteroidota bacterium]|nr:orotate phosphoribosyltransferase [Bacteroidota bacterium]